MPALAGFIAPLLPALAALPEFVPPIIFTLLVIASVWSFCGTLRQRFLPKTKRSPGLSLDHIKDRLWRVFTEVLLQYRVIRDRPLVGLLHALVMWGFLAFLWVSLEHLSLVFRGLAHAQAPHGWYAAFAAAWAVAVLAGITGLAFRRFVLRPKALGALSPTSGIVSALIALLMVTYLLGWRVLAAGSVAWKANWWLHTLCFLSLLVIIPKSKHLHLFLGPVAVFFRSKNTSVLRPLSNDDDFGLLHFSELSWKHVLQLNACVECGRCTDACPAQAVGKSLSPKEVVLGMQHGLLQGGDVIAGSSAELSSGKAWVSEHDLFQCFTCGACEEACAAGMEHVGGKILDLRRGLASEGRISNEKIVSLFASMERQPRNPWAMGRNVRQKFLEGEQFPLFDGSQEWLLWLGCSLSFDPHGRSVARAMKTVLEAAGASWGVLEHETCCGEAARKLGNEYLYLEMAEELIATFQENKVRKLVTCCPHCAAMFEADYRQIPAYAELNIEVRHHSELLAELLERLELAPEKEVVAYHDPCYLARARGIVEQPRAVLAACGAGVREMAHHGSRTFCCGGGGAQIFIADDREEAGAGRVNHHRFTEVAATGASTVAVACPYCPTMLRDAANHANRDDVEILDIAEIVANRLRKEGSERCTPERFAHTV